MKQRKSTLLKGGFFSIIGLVLAITIILILFYFLATVYFKRTVNKDERTAQYLHEQNLDTKNYQTILDSTRKKLDQINKQRMDQYRLYDQGF